MKRKLLEKTTTSNYVYRIVAVLPKLNCDRCHPHRGCNRKWFVSRSWKDQNKKRKQWM
jgi:hypothetical protein